MSYSPELKAAIKARDAAAKAGEGTITRTGPGGVANTMTGSQFRGSQNPEDRAEWDQMLATGRSDPNLMFGPTKGRAVPAEEKAYRAQYKKFMENPNKGVDAKEALGALAMFATVAVGGGALASMASGAGAGAGAAAGAGAGSGAGAGTGAGIGFGGAGTAGLPANLSLVGTTGAAAPAAGGLSGTLGTIGTMFPKVAPYIAKAAPYVAKAEKAYKLAKLGYGVGMATGMIGGPKGPKSPNRAMNTIASRVAGQGTPGLLGPETMPMPTSTRRQVAFAGDPHRYGMGPEHSFFENTPAVAAPQTGVAPPYRVPMNSGGALNDVRNFNGKGSAHSGTIPQFVSGGTAAGGREDNIDAKLSENEYVIDAETVALLGDGSPEAGAKKLDTMRKNIRSHKGKALAHGAISPNAKDSPLAYLAKGGLTKLMAEVNKGAKKMEVGRRMKRHSRVETRKGQRNNWNDNQFWGNVKDRVKNDINATHDFGLEHDPEAVYSKGGKIGALGKPFLLSKKQRVGVRMGEFGVQDAETAKLVEVDRKRAGHRKVDEVKRRVNDLHEWKLEDRKDSVYAKGGIVKSVKDVIRQLDAKGDWHNDAAIAQHSQALRPVAQRMLKKVVEGRRKMPGQYAKGGGILSQVAKILKSKPKADPNAGLIKIRDDLDKALTNKPGPITPVDMTTYFEEHMRKRDALKRRGEE